MLKGKCEMMAHEYFMEIHLKTIFFTKTKYIFKMFTQKYERTNESIKLTKVENMKEILTITDLYCFVPL